MAQVAHETQLHAWINRSLAYLVSEWAAVPTIAAEWSAWDEPDRLDFVLEWPLREDRLLQLKRWSDDGQLTAPQSQRFAELQALVRQHRATLERLLAE